MSKVVTAEKVDDGKVDSQHNLEDVRRSTETARKKMLISYEKIPKNCFMCGVEPFAHLTSCDCCNHYFCIDCIDKFNQLKHILVKRKFIDKNEKLGHVKTLGLKLGNDIYCLCNTSLRCHIEDENGKPIHYTSDEQKTYTFFELMNFHKEQAEKNINKEHDLEDVRDPSGFTDEKEELVETVKPSPAISPGLSLS